MVHSARSCVDRHEAHLVTMVDGREVVHPHYQRPEAGRSYIARNAANVFPQAYISRVEAAAACRNAKKRLCHWLEWRRACQGPRWLRYPYSNGKKKGYCNVGKDHLMPKLFGGDERKWKYEEHFNSPKQNQLEGFLAKSGAYAKCVTVEGAHDMVGNLHEWVSTSVSRSFMERLEKEGVHRNEQPWAAGNGMFLGGFYSTTNEHGPGCHYTTVAHEPAYHDYSIGFRCCATAKKRKKTAPRRHRKHKQR